VRVWDVPAGYLSRQSLLGEHRELHGLHAILVEGKRGYAHHPETLRWVECLSGLSLRHALLAAEMRLRGYSDRTPIASRRRTTWPQAFVTAPGAQYALLRTKYRDTQCGRIPLPQSPQDLWAHHKYSVLARDPETCRSLGRRVSRMRQGTDLSPLALELVEILRTVPPPAGMVNAIEHMWGHVSSAASASDRSSALSSLRRLLGKTQELALGLPEPYLMQSTALSELAVFLPTPS
jgi:hypothetical protein